MSCLSCKEAGKNKLVGMVLLSIYFMFAASIGTYHIVKYIMNIF